MKKLGLIMRKGYGIHEDHIETLSRIADEIHLWTQVAHSATDDPRFSHVYRVAETDEETLVHQMVQEAKAAQIEGFLTWQETDIVLTARCNAALGRQDVPITSAVISRNKLNQREFLRQHDMPTPLFRGVRHVDEARMAADEIGYPCILKPTMAASSVNVSLISSEEALIQAFSSLESFIKKDSGLYYTDRSVAVLEEFMPGEEITLDGVVVDGVFHLGGIHNKKRMMGPHFEEDEYTLPYQGGNTAPLAEIAARICQALRLKNTLFNVELRQDRNGVYKVVEFSIRISGGHVYRNIRDVYGIDLVAAYTLGLINEQPSLIEWFLRRSPQPKAATCIKFVYRSGHVRQNDAGAARSHPAFRAYYPVAKPGERIDQPPQGFDIAGLLSVRGRYREPEDVNRLKETAAQLEQQLDLIVD
jgi:biotin carboxylase